MSAYNTSAARDPENFADNAEYERSDVFRYPRPKRPEFNVDRLPRRLTPQQNEYRAKGNNVIVFDIPNDAIYDMSEAMLYFNVRIIRTGGTYGRIANGAWNLFSRVRHLANNRKVEEKIDYGDIFSVEWVYESDNDIESTLGVDLFGIGTQATRNTWGADPNGKNLASPMKIGFITAGMFPAKFLKERQQLEIYIQDPLICLESDGASLDISISNIRLQTFIVKDSLTTKNKFGKSVDSSGYEASLKAFIESGQFCVAYDSWETFQNQVFSVNHDLVISHRAEAVKLFLTYFRNENDRANPLVNDKLMTYPKNNITSYQFKFNSAYYPEIPIDCSGDGLEAYHQYLHWVNSYKLGGFVEDQVDNPNVTLGNFNSSEFLIVADLTVSPEKKFIGTISTLDHNVDPQLNVKFSAPPPAGTVAMHLIKFSTIAKIDPSTTRIYIVE